MDRITLQNYRCFGSEEQSARLAPLTLLVGPNSTGKTSFLALIRALWDVAFREVVPNFREHPYDLGSWDDIVYDPGGRKHAAGIFIARLGVSCKLIPKTIGCNFALSLPTATQQPFPTVRSFKDRSIEWPSGISRKKTMKVPLNRARYSLDGGAMASAVWLSANDTLAPFSLIFRTGTSSWSGVRHDGARAVRTAVRLIFCVADSRPMVARRPFAGAPIRSGPHRTYDPMSVGAGRLYSQLSGNLLVRNADELAIAQRMR